MTSIVEEAFEAVRRLPPPARENVARAILTLAAAPQPLDIEPEHLPAVLEGLAQIEGGVFATDAEVDEAFRSFGP